MDIFMKGSVILFSEDHEMKILEGVEKPIYDKIKQQEAAEHCFITLDEREIDLGYVSPVYWREGQIDME